MEGLTISENLPHIGEKIFGNLIIEDLFHCQLVCKAWNLFLTNPMFWLKKLKIFGQSKEITQKWMELIQRSNELQLHKEAISKCLKAIFVSINTRNKTFQLNKPPIQIAIQFGVVEVLELLAEVNEDFNQQILETIVGLQSDQRKPPLHYVIQDRNHKNKLEILKFLAFKCNPNLKDCHQKTALHLAIEKRWIEAVKILVPLTDDLTEHKTILYTSVIREIIATERSRRGQAQPQTQAQPQAQPQQQPSQPIKKKKEKKKSSKKKDQKTQRGTQPETQIHLQIQPVAMFKANIAPQTSQSQTAQLGPQPRNLLTQTQQETQFVSQTRTQPKSRRGQPYPQTQQETQFVSQSGTQPQAQQETQVVSPSGTQTQLRTQHETQVVSQCGTQPQTQPRTQQETQFVSQSGTQPQLRTQQETQVVSQCGTQPQTQQETQSVSQSETKSQPRTEQETQVVSHSGTQLKSKRDQAQPGTQHCTQQEIQFVNQSGTQPKTTTHQIDQSQMTQSQTSQLQGAQPQPSKPINKKGKKNKCKKKENIKFLMKLGITEWR